MRDFRHDGRVSGFRLPTNSSDVNLIVLFNSHGPLFPLLNSLPVIPELHLVSSSLLTDPVLQVPTHVAEYVPLTCFSTWVYVHVSISAAPVCNKRWWRQTFLVTCWACLVCHSFNCPGKIMRVFPLGQPFCPTPTTAACTLWEERTMKASQ